MRFDYSVTDNILTNGQGNIAQSAGYGGKRRDFTRITFAPFEFAGGVATPYSLPAQVELIFVLEPAKQYGQDPVAIAALSQADYDSNKLCYTGVVDVGTVQITQRFVGASAINAQTGTNYQLVATDKTKLVTIKNASANTITLPKDDAGAWSSTDPVWLMCAATADAAGTCTVVEEFGANIVLDGPKNKTLLPGIPVLATKTAAHTWTLSIPPEPESINLAGEWTWRDTTLSSPQWQSTPSFAFVLDNDYYRGGEGYPASTADPSNYPTNAAMAAAIAAEATARNTAIATSAATTGSLITAEATARGSADTTLGTAISTEAAARATADLLLLPKLAILGADITTASYTLAAADAFQRRRCAYVGAFAVNVPTNASVSIPVGSRYPFDRAIGGGTTITPASGVTILSLNGILAQAINDAGMSIELLKVATDVWTAVLSRPPSRYEIQRGEAGVQLLTDVIASGGTVSWDLANGHNAELRFSAFATRVLGLPTNRIPGSKGILFVKQDATGSRTLTYNAVFIQVNATIALNTAASSYTRLDWFDNGVNILLNKA